jgi:hypothetical protein
MHFGGNMCFIQLVQTSSSFFCSEARIANLLDERNERDQDDWIQFAEEVNDIMNRYKEVLSEYKNERWV